jgi:P4 family phage/plasmid primase-like protien
VARFGDEFRYVSEWGKWFRWTGTYWKRLETSAAADTARRMLAAEAETIANPDARRALQFARKVSAVMAMVRTDPQIDVATDIWDQHPYLLNTPAGTIDLTTGKIRKHDPPDHLTQITKVSPADTADCPQFLAFLDRIFDPQSELITYHQKLFGYCLSGDVSEQQFWFGHGFGNNGKSLLLNTVAYCLGSYHRRTAVETFTLKPQDQHTTAIADLRGARLVTASESKENRIWDEALIKEMTGEETIKARFMRQDFFDIPITWKIYIFGNHKPRLLNIGEAIVRRANLVPFAVKIPEAERDRKMAGKLKSEAPGILRWMIVGYSCYLKEGLKPPLIVATATKTWMDDQDSIGQWIEDCCVLEPQLSLIISPIWTSTKNLYRSYAEWAWERGLFRTWINSFSSKLEERGLIKQRGRAGGGDTVGFLGIRLKKNAGGPADGIPY